MEGRTEAARVTQLQAQVRRVAGDLETACQLAEWAWQADPTDAAARSARSDIYDRRADGETSLMARSIYVGAADEARRVADHDDTPVNQ